MHRIATTCFYVSAIFLTASTVTVERAVATDTETGGYVVKSQRHAPTATLGHAQQPTCSWVGPGGRAIYICK